MGIGPNLDLGMSSVLKDPLYAALQHTITRLKIIPSHSVGNASQVVGGNGVTVPMSRSLRVSCSLVQRLRKYGKPL